MRNPVSFGIALVAAFSIGFVGVIAAVQATRSQGRIRLLNTVASVLCMLAACAIIALNVWLWVP
jgi:CHASE2 domain-containing sensor protein